MNITIQGVILTKYCARDHTELPYLDTGQTITDSTVNDKLR